MRAPAAVTVFHTICSQSHSDDERDVIQGKSPAESSAVELQSASVDSPTESSFSRPVERLISGVKVSRVEIGFEHDSAMMSLLLLYFSSTVNASATVRYIMSHLSALFDRFRLFHYNNNHGYVIGR